MSALGAPRIRDGAGLGSRAAGPARCPLLRKSTAAVLSVICVEQLLPLPAAACPCSDGQSRMSRLHFAKPSLWSMVPAGSQHRTRALSRDCSIAAALGNSGLKHRVIAAASPRTQPSAGRHRERSASSCPGLEQLRSRALPSRTPHTFTAWHSGQAHKPLVPSGLAPGSCPDSPAPLRVSDLLACLIHPPQLDRASDLSTTNPISPPAAPGL